MQWWLSEPSRATLLAMAADEAGVLAGSRRSAAWVEALKADGGGVADAVAGLLARVLSAER